ncbi:MAG: hypothetical protein ACP5C4_02495 [Methanomicrobiales archaeon]
MRPLPFLCLVCAIVACLFIVGCLEDSGTQPTTPAPTSSPTPTMATPAPTTVTPAPTSTLPQSIPASQSDSGSGDTTLTLPLDEGTYLVAARHDRQSPFTVQVWSREMYQDVIIHRGSTVYSGTQAMGIPEKGWYTMQITTGGPWTVTVKEPRTQGTVVLPYTFTGTGDWVSGTFDLAAGNYSFTMTNDGSGPFAVWLYSMDGEPVMDPTGTYVEPLHWHEGPYSGTETAVIEEDGTYLLNVKSSGKVIIEMKKA